MTHYMWNLKGNNTNELTQETKRLRVKNKLMAAREFGMDMDTLLYLKQITNKVLLYSTGNSA